MRKQYCGCWWPSDSRSYGINSHNIDPVCMEYPHCLCGKCLQKIDDNTSHFRKTIYWKMYFTKINMPKTTLYTNYKSYIIKNNEKQYIALNSLYMNHTKIWQCAHSFSSHFSVLCQNIKIHLIPCSRPENKGLPGMSLDQKTKDYVLRPENKGLCPCEKPNIVLVL